MIRKSMPSGYDPTGGTGFPSRQTRNAFARRSCSNKRIERDDDSKKSHPALVCQRRGAAASAPRTSAFRRSRPRADPIVGLASRQRKQHGYAPSIAVILVAEQSDEIALFELDADQDVASRRHCKQQVTRSHQWGRPEGEQEAQIDRMPHQPIKQRCVKFRCRQISAEQAREYLAEAE